MRDLIAPPMARRLHEMSRYAVLLDRVFQESRVTGNPVHDARIVALAPEHGVSGILVLDGDLARFPRAACRHPWRA